MSKKSKKKGNPPSPVSRQIDPADLVWIQSTRLEMLHEHGIDPENFEILLTGKKSLYTGDEEGLIEPGVEYEMANRLILNLRFCANLDPHRTVLILMKTKGGFWEEGMAMYDAITLTPNPVTIFSFTHARSMSSIILQAADHRVLMPNSYFLFHQGSSSVYGTAKFAQTALGWDREFVQPKMMDIYINSLINSGRLTRLTREEIARTLLTPFAPDNKSLEAAVIGLLSEYRHKIDVIRQALVTMMDWKEDVYLTSQQAVEFGFADEVFNGDWDNLKK